MRMRISPMAARRPLMTLVGKNAAMNPSRNVPMRICMTPAMATAARKGSNPPSAAIWAATMAVRPAAGPLTLLWDPLRTPTAMPPMMPEMMPEKSGALEARAMPRQSGSATRKTAMLAVMSRGSVAASGGLLVDMERLGEREMERGCSSPG